MGNTNTIILDWIKEAKEINASGASFIAPFSPSVERILEIALKLQVLTPHMPTARSNDFRSSILAADYLEPIFYELDVASHYWRLGYDLEWSCPGKPNGTRSPEFLAVRGSRSIEVECKTTSPDTGRMIRRPQFLRLADL